MNFFVEMNRPLLSRNLARCLTAKRIFSRLNASASGVAARPLANLTHLQFGIFVLLGFLEGFLSLCVFFSSLLSLLIPTLEAHFPAILLSKYCRAICFLRWEA